MEATMAHGTFMQSQSRLSEDLSDPGFIVREGCQQQYYSKYPMAGFGTLQTTAGVDKKIGPAMRTSIELKQNGERLFTS